MAYILPQEVNKKGKKPHYKGQILYVSTHEVLRGASSRRPGVEWYLPGMEGREDEVLVYNWDRVSFLM